MAVVLVAEPSTVRASAQSKACPSALQIAAGLNTCRFTIYRHVNEVPAAPLTESGLLLRGSKLSNVMIDPGPDSGAGHTMIDLAKPLYQLIFAGSCSDTFFIYFKARDPQGTGNIMLIQSKHGKGYRPIAGFTPARAHNLKELIRQLENCEYEPIDLRDSLANPFRKIE